MEKLFWHSVLLKISLFELARNLPSKKPRKLFREGVSLPQNHLGVAVPEEAAGHYVLQTLEKLSTLNLVLEKYIL